MLSLKNKTLIGLSGAAGSGKDFAAQVLEQSAGLEIVSFAEPVYKSVSLLTGIPVDALQRRVTKEHTFFVEITNNNFCTAVAYVRDILRLIKSPLEARDEIYSWLCFDVFPEHTTSPFFGVHGDTIGTLRISPRRLLELFGTEFGRNRITENIWLDLVAAKYGASKKGIVVTDVRFPNEDKWVKETGGKRVHIVAPDSPYQITSTHASASHTFEVDEIIVNNYDSHFVDTVKAIL